MTIHISAQEYRDSRCKSKYKNKITEYRGVKYHSKLEAEFAFRLDQLKQQTAIQSWTRQVGFDIGNGKKHVVDFLVFHRDGRCELIEIKGKDLEAGQLKRMLVKQIHGIDITVLTRETAGRWEP